VKAPVFETSETVFSVKKTAGYWFDIMDGTKKARFTKELKQKWAELLIFNCFTCKEAKPVIRINNTCRRIRRYAPDFTAYSAKSTPPAGRKVVTYTVHWYASNGIRIKQGLNVVSNS
jgi:hypothetical protein